MFVRKIWKGTELQQKGQGMFVRKIDVKSETWTDFMQLYESMISIDVEFCCTIYDTMLFKVCPHGKYNENVRIALTFSTNYNDKCCASEVETLFKTIGLLMERKNGIVAIYPDKHTKPNIVKQVEEIAERVSMYTDTVFWFCIKKISTDEVNMAKKYFDFCGVTEEEWLFL